MLITPNASPESSNSAAQNTPATLAGWQARRNSAAGAAAYARESREAGGTQVAGPESLRLNTAAADDISSGPEIADASGADSVMHSLRAAMLAQPGTAMAGQAGLSPQSVLDLLG